MSTETPKLKMQIEHGLKETGEYVQRCGTTTKDGSYMKWK